ncbi:unnamed protein product [Hymenolepis diminuta]|uniref:Uncharacterized protein n=1 Tax=Hymenolepis diminuta TaxID=6216 RepID=A0A564XWZ0_HYMDI|nr:unnamed protein product [Hymenolepis diminuta]
MNRHEQLAQLHSETWSHFWEFKTRPNLSQMSLSWTYAFPKNGGGASQRAERLRKKNRSPPPRCLRLPQDRRDKVLRTLVFFSICEILTMIGRHKNVIHVSVYNTGCSRVHVILKIPDKGYTNTFAYQSELLELFGFY